MAYFNPSSRHPDTLICVKNHAVSELQWRTKDLLQLAEQSHALWKITFLTSALPHIKKNGQLATASKVKKNAELLTSKWQIVTEPISACALIKLLGLTPLNFHPLCLDPDLLSGLLTL